ncbi:MAG: flagellar export chaperone FliS [Synergistaceae bacterium]|nr:flagellar export chaperone FliS [Synergistaceae bacterium]
MENVAENKIHQDAQENYQTTQISTATKEQLLLITYDIGIRSCQTAEGALEGKDYELANRELVRAQNVIRELMVTLNVDRGGEVAESLMRLYDFMHNYLVQANIDKDSSKVAIVTNMLKELRQTWEDALMKLLEEYRAENPEMTDAADMRSRTISSGESKTATASVVQPSIKIKEARSGQKGVNFAG